MPTMKRFKVKGYKGVFYILGTSPATGKPERVYYIRYISPSGKLVEEKVGRATVRRAGAEQKGEMTPLEASNLRADRMRGREPSNQQRREAEEAARRAADARWDFSRLFTAYMEAKGEYPRKVTDSGNWRAHLVNVVGKKTPAELTSFDVDRIRINMKKPRKVIIPSRKPDGKDREVTKGRCKPGTVVAALGLLVRLGSFGVKRKLCEGIGITVELPKGGAVKTEQMDDGQMTAYLAAAEECENKVIGAFMTFLLLTGLRLNEARSLRWDAVDLQRGAVHLRAPKGKRDQFLPLNPAAVDLLSRLPRDPENEYVFQGEKDEKGKRKRSGRIGTSTAVRYGRKFAKAAGLPDNFRPNHGLRHSFASALASSGEVDMYVLQKLMTHRSPAMTQRYAHLTDAALKRGANVMGRIVAGVEKTKKAEAV